MQSRRGFTLIEVLVVVAIIALLISILIPSLNRAREQTRRTTCAANQHQIMLGAQMYAEQDPSSIYVYKDGDGGDSIWSLHPKYLRDARVAICPSTKNVIRPKDDLNVPLGDLKKNAKGREDDSGGHSYEMRTWMWHDYTFNGFKPPKERYFDAKTGSWLERHDPIKSLKNVKRPYNMLLFADADESPPGINNWPDIHDNHGADGVNVAYCDGHVEWTRTGRKLMLSYLTGYYYPSLPDTYYPKYGVTRSGDTFKW